jgi:hypothetical protein
MSSEKGIDRRSFIKASAGVATGAAAVGMPAVAVLGVPATALGDKRKAVPVSSDAAPPAEPVMAYIHDADRGEVTVLAGTAETTYRDPALVKHLQELTSDHPTGGTDVLAS